MESSSWIDRLQSDEALTDNLDDDQASLLLHWGEARLGACMSDAEAERVIATVRGINRRVGDGEEFEKLFPPPTDALASAGDREKVPDPIGGNAADAEQGPAADPVKKLPPAGRSTNDSGEPSPDDQSSAENNQRPSHSA